MTVTPLKWWRTTKRWAELFAVAERELRAVLAPVVVAIEHIGSTAVPGPAAKAAIDIQVGVRTLDDSPEIVVAVESLGYEYVPEFEDELPDRRYFRRWANGRRSHQIHLVERSNTDWWDRHVRFRDWLRNPNGRSHRASLLRSRAAGHLPSTPPSRGMGRDEATPRSTRRGRPTRLYPPRT